MHLVANRLSSSNFWAWIAVPGSEAPLPCPVRIEEAPRRLRVGDVCTVRSTQVMVHAVSICPDAQGMLHQLVACRITSGRLAQGASTVELARPGLAVAVVTLSDKGSRGEREDTSGPAVLELLQDSLSVTTHAMVVIPDDAPTLKRYLMDLCLVQGFDLVVTSGGTGVAPRDITPEVTLAAIERRLPGLETAMMLAALQKTPHAALSRAVAGTLGESIVLNLPGSPKAVRENLAAVVSALPHAIAKLQGDESDCGSKH